MASRKSSGEQGTLIEPPKVKVPVGPVYQGTCAQIRAMFPDGDPDAKRRKELNLGTIAQARSVAASIDRVSGHPVNGYPTRQAAGMQLAALHHQLDELLSRLAGDGEEEDEFDKLRREMAEAAEAAAAEARARAGNG